MQKDQRRVEAENKAFVKFVIRVKDLKFQVEPKSRVTHQSSFSGE